MAGSLDYFVEKFLMVKWVWDRVALKPSPAPCWFGWLILAVWPLMVLIGITTQWAVTGRGIHHQEREWAQSGLFVSFYPSILELSPLSYDPPSCVKIRFSFQIVLTHSLVVLILKLLIIRLSFNNSSSFHSLMFVTKKGKKIWAEEKM
jgi:hypothetical protein